MPKGGVCGNADVVRGGSIGSIRGKHAESRLLAGVPIDAYLTHGGGGERECQGFLGVYPNFRRSVLGRKKSRILVTKGLF